MEFGLSQEQTMLRDMLRRFLAEHCDHEARRRMLASGAAYDAGLFAQLAELGILGALFDERQGGFGGGGSDIAVVFEELGRAGVIAPVLGNAVLAGALVAEHRAELVAEVIAGRSVLALAHSEPGSRYDLAAVAAAATQEADNVTLSGTKTHVMDGARADLLVVSAREYGGERDADGIGLFLVAADTPGLDITAQRNVDGTSSANVVLRGARLGADARLAAPGDGLALIERAAARATLAVCAEAVGAMEAAKDLTVAYLKERKQFGVPIGSFQALQHRMADMLIEIEQARSATINLAAHIDAGRDTRERHVSAAKNLIGRVGAMVAEECIQMHGGIGMTDEYALSHFARRLVMIDHLFGDVDHHLERFIALSSVT